MTSRLSEDGKTVIVLPGTKKLRDKEYKGNTKIERVVCTKNMEEIGDLSFFGCTSLTSIELKPGLKRIGNCTFWDCDRVTHVSFVEGMEEIGDLSFQHCTALTSIELKPGLKTIGDATFEGCCQLTHVSFVNGMNEIGYGSFQDCISLQSISLKPDLKNIGIGTFQECSELTAIVVPFEDVPTSLRSSQVTVSAYQRLMGQIRKGGAHHLKNLIVSRPLTCPERLTFDLNSFADACASEFVEIRDCEYNIAQSLHLVMFMLSKFLGAACFSRYRMLVLVY